MYSQWKEWHHSQRAVGNTRDNDKAFHGQEELVSLCSLKNIMTGKDMFLKLWVTLASVKVGWKKQTDDGRNL
jgi:hypothetical protein